MESDRNAKNRSLTQIHAQMMEIPEAEQKTRIQNRIEQCDAKIKAFFNALQHNALVAQQLESAAHSVAGMQIPLVQKKIADAAYKSRVTNVPASALRPAMNGALRVYQ